MIVVVNPLMDLFLSNILAVFISVPPSSAAYSLSLSEQSNITFNHGKSLFFFRYSSHQFYCRLDILLNLVILTKKWGEARGGGVHHFSGSYTQTFNHLLTSLEY